MSTNTNPPPGGQGTADDDSKSFKQKARLWIIGILLVLAGAVLLHEFREWGLLIIVGAVVLVMTAKRWFKAAIAVTAFALFCLAVHLFGWGVALVLFVVSLPIAFGLKKIDYNKARSLAQSGSNRVATPFRQGGTFRRNPGAPRRQLSFGWLKSPVFIGVLGLLAVIAVIGAFVLGRSTAGGADTADLAQRISALESSNGVKDNELAANAVEIKAKTDANARLTQELADAKKAPVPVQGPVIVPVNFSSEDSVGAQMVKNVAAQQGFDPSKIVCGDDKINIALAKSVAVGGSSFGESVFTSEGKINFFNSGTDESKANFNKYKEKGFSDANLIKQSNWTACQYLQDVEWRGNTFYLDGRAVVAGSKIDPAGTVGIYYTGPEVVSKISNGNLDPKFLFGDRGACVNPQEEMARPVTPRTYVPPPVTPPHGGGCTQPNGCLPPPPCMQPNNCQPPNDCTTHPEAPECQPPDDCTTHPENPECQPPSDCTTNPEAPECQPEHKCEGVSLDDICGGYDNGGDQQGPQDNDPPLVAPTDGYNPDDAEETIGNQTICDLVTTLCGLDSSVDGTGVEGSEDGGFAPGGDVTVPVPGGTDGSGGDNPNASGEPVWTNTDQGTSNDADSTEANNEGSGTDAAAGSDPFGSLPLQNVVPDNGPAAPQSEALVAPQTLVAPAPVQPAPSSNAEVTSFDHSTTSTVVAEPEPAPVYTSGSQVAVQTGNDVATAPVVAPAQVAPASTSTFVPSAADSTPTTTHSVAPSVSSVVPSTVVAPSAVTLPGVG